MIAYCALGFLNIKNCVRYSCWEGVRVLLKAVNVDV